MIIYHKIRWKNSFFQACKTKSNKNLQGRVNKNLFNKDWLNWLDVRIFAIRDWIVSSAGLERCLDRAEVAGSNPAQFTEANPPFHRVAKLLCPTKPTAIQQNTAPSPKPIIVFHGTYRDLPKTGELVVTWDEQPHHLGVVDLSRTHPIGFQVRVIHLVLCVRERLATGCQPMFPVLF